MYMYTYYIYVYIYVYICTWPNFNDPPSSSKVILDRCSWVGEVVRVCLDLVSGTALQLSWVFEALDSGCSIHDIVYIISCKKQFDRVCVFWCHNDSQDIYNSCKTVFMIGSLMFIKRPPWSICLQIKYEHMETLKNIKKTCVYTYINLI